MDYEVKADTLDAAFEGQDAVQPLARPLLSGGTALDPARAAFVNGYLRKGSEVELKSFVGSTGAEGGFAIPREIDAAIDATLKSISPIRAIANVVRVGSSGYRKLVTTGGTPSGWAAEADPRPMTGTSSFSEIVPAFVDLYANPAASQAMLDGAAFDVEGWLASEIAIEFAKAEGTAFVTGNGTNKPRGFLASPVSATPDTARPFGTLQYLATGAVGAFATTNPAERLIDLVHALRAPYRQGAVWVMNATTLAAIRKFKTTDGAYLLQPSLTAGAADMLLGYPVVEAEDMPDIIANSLSIAFGNFKAGYLIAERSETTILRDPFTNKPFVHFYASKRVGGIVSNSEAIKLLRFSAA
jgi:HK97 family phage major capsid protein